MKAPLDVVNYRAKYYEFIVKAILRSIGVPIEKLTFVVGSSYQLSRDYTLDRSGIFKSSNPRMLAKAIVNAVNDFDEPEKLLQCSKGLGKLMFGVQISGLAKSEIMATRG